MVKYPYPQGTITPIAAITHVTDDSAKKDNTFAISTPTRLFFCSAETYPEMKSWISNGFIRHFLFYNY